MTDRYPKMKFRIILVVALTASFSARAEVLRIAQLKEGDQIHIKLRSRGCFHDFTKFYDIAGGTRISISERGNPNRKMFLSPAQIHGMDTLLEFYRQRIDGGCTTGDWIQIGYYRGEKNVGREEFFDRTCLTDFADWTEGTQSFLEKQTNGRYDLKKLKQIVSLSRIDSELAKISQ